MVSLNPTTSSTSNGNASTKNSVSSAKSTVGSARHIASSTRTKKTKPSHVTASATELMHEGQKLANELYEQSIDKLGDTQDVVKQYSDSLITKIHKNPLTSVLIAAGVGALLSALFKK